MPGDAGDLCGRITYIRDMKKYKEERGLTNFGSRHKSSILAVLLHGIVKVFRTLNLRRIVKHERPSIPFDFSERTSFDFCFTELWTFSFWTRIKKNYTIKFLTWHLCFRSPLELDFSIILVNDYSMLISWINF